MPFESPQPGASNDPVHGSRVPIETLRDLDQRLRGRFAELSGGQSPWAAVQAWEDWAFHLSVSPGRQIELGWRWMEAMLALGRAQNAPCSEADNNRQVAPDRRFRGEGWSQAPFSHLAQFQLAAESQWRCATANVRGVAEDHARRVEFMGSFLLNAMAPVNFPATNPDVIEAGMKSGGFNFAAGATLLAEDLGRIAAGQGLKGLDVWDVGTTMALTPGEVVYRNEFMELIQYSPQTKNVQREPILIVPAWIMKYYILDLTPEESLVRYLVTEGFTVFIISWKNPSADMRDASFEDYRRSGVMAALDVVGRLVPDEKVHGVGYCLGGTVLAIAAAAMDRDNDERLATLTLLAAQTDFEEAGELLMFIDESQLAVLEDMMHVSGFLDARDMAAAFSALRANELVFAKLVDRYFLGLPRPPTAMDAWLADPTRMPARMHGEYLRQLFMENQFAHGDYQVAGRAAALKDIHVPIFALGADRDHIAPWRSVYKIELYGAAETTFILTGGGHNSSVVSPPGKKRAYYRISCSKPGADYVDPDQWLSSAAQVAGSWWPEWSRWLRARSEKELVKARQIGGKAVGLELFGPAPGEYVHAR